MPSKYGSKKIVIDGITFDSKDEARYYEYLKKKKSKGKIVNFELQPKYTLIPAFKKNSKSYRAMTYTPDFIIYNLDGSEELIDVKGFSTQQGEIRKKLFDYKYADLKLTWISRSLKFGDEYGWIEYSELKKKRSEEKKRKERK
ncbi:DUF1064 domain-containing protein [Clostridium oceanicum]|uniref:DUF1064 domain-containing protein n=1 Tax=Clostridium oceanicum TaxID=1543 RepID=A0ABP3UIM8_9CLOT